MNQSGYSDFTRISHNTCKSREHGWRREKERCGGEWERGRERERGREWESIVCGNVLYPVLFDNGMEIMELEFVVQIN
jgi:hypothetical protein